MRGTCRRQTAYTFTGNPQEVLSVRTPPRKATVTERYIYTYGSRTDNLLTVTHSVNGSAPVTIASYTYDALGRVASKVTGGIETTSYAYNVRSWPTKMQGPKFTELLAYNEAANGLTPSTPQWSGKVSAVRWYRGTTTIKPAYQFTYDGVGRLAEATYTQNTYLMNRRPKYTETYFYDAMGNVTALTRQGWLYGSTWGLIDDLVMTYEGNRLVKCDDAVSAQPTYNGVHHFTDLADEDEEYEYDGNGNMTKDLNREITSIEYNSLNLPEQITFYDGTKMKLTYDAAGNKLRAEYWTIGTFNPGGPIGPASLGGGNEPMGGGIVGPILPPINQNDPQAVTDYCGNVIYRNDTLSMLLTEEGYVTFDERGEPLYHYYLKDHLGSVRVVLDGDGTVEQVNDYYPSGTLMYTSTNGTVQPYKFGQKELERTLPLDEYDFGARWMDPVVGGRFTTMDPMCEKYYSVSSYAYCHGDPLNWIDPDGRFPNVFTAAISNIWQKIRHPHQYVSNIIDHGDRIEPERQYTYTTVDYHSEEGITVTSHSKFDWDGVWADAKTSGETIQDIGNYATIVGLGISVICPAIGAPIAKFGDIISTIGQYISLLADIKLGNSADIVQDVISISLDAGTRKVRGLIDNLDDAEDMAKYILKFFSVSEEKLLNESVDKHIDNH